jgi:hypothetical protein
MPTTQKIYGPSWFSSSTPPRVVGKIAAKRGRFFDGCRGLLARLTKCMQAGGRKPSNTPAQVSTVHLRVAAHDRPQNLRIGNSRSGFNSGIAGTAAIIFFRPSVTLYGTAFGLAVSHNGSLTCERSPEPPRHPTTARRFLGKHPNRASNHREGRHAIRHEDSSAAQFA